jgi:Flp pilus assembly protein TadG
MQNPLITKPLLQEHTSERGVTMVFVALAMVAIIAMAALSIDVITLYLAREEAQRSADQAALAAARILSMSGITGDPSNGTGNWGVICGPNGVATHAAQAMVAQNTVGRLVPGTINVTYAAGNGGAITSSTDCQTLGGANSAFGVNPMVTVQLTRASLPTFFSRIWGNTGNSVSATATAEAFNPSNSGNVFNQTGGTITPVQPRCVKPWVVANEDPFHRDPLHVGACNFGLCTGGPGGDCAKIVKVNDGSIACPGISSNGSGAAGIIGETFWLVADCRFNQSGCNLRVKGFSSVQPQANLNNGSPNIQGPPNLLYVPNQIGTTPTGVPSCSTDSDYEEAIGGCDQPTNYSCGVQNANTADLSINPDIDTGNGVQCLIHQGSAGDVTNLSGQDSFNVGAIAPPTSYPFQILAGTANPMVTAGLPGGTPITSSTSVVSLPIYDNVASPSVLPGTTNAVTFVGFLQVFINAVDQKGNINVTVLNVAGCGGGATPPGTAVTGTSPVPIRLITAP